MKSPTLNDSHAPLHHRGTVRRVILQVLNFVACTIVMLVIAFLMWATWLPTLTAGKK